MRSKLQRKTKSSDAAVHQQGINGQTRLASAGLSVAPTIAFPLLAQSIFVEAGFPQILTDLLARRPRLGLARLTIPATIALALLA
jgi:hypothetical protein